LWRSKIALAISAAISRLGLPPGLPFCPGFHGLNSPHPCLRPPLFFLAMGDIRHVFACFYAILMGED
jgi:hypothetical protein